MSKTKLALDVVTDLRNLAGSIETLVFALKHGDGSRVSENRGRAKSLCGGC
ncbi:hypothetical protein [Metabacillus schmidteae]|uniref:hypothetical protein n=1 Tax=Metabacillus schmidteae TaxID=2730405 RepID=UPI00158A3CF3|nr:hypothetical protein [Metabacillus schmidteae]